jgi:NhaP-type Na+/H+ or K+/H+ antiporter
MLLVITSIVGIVREIIILVIVILIARWITGFFSTRNHTNQNNQTVNYSQRDNVSNSKMDDHKKRPDTTKKGEYVEYEEVE